MTLNKTGEQNMARETSQQQLQEALLNLKPSELPKLPSMLAARIVLEVPNKNTRE